METSCKIVGIAKNQLESKNSAGRWFWKEGRIQFSNLNFFVKIFWGVWKDRCNFSHITQHQGPLFTNGCTNYWSEAYINVFRKAQLKLSDPAHSRRLMRSKPGQWGMLHPFVGAAYNNSTLAFATDFAIYDPGGKLWIARYRRIPPDSNSGETPSYSR